MVDRWKTIPSPMSYRVGVGKGEMGVGIDSGLSSFLYNVAASTREFFQKHYCDLHTDPRDMGAPDLFQPPSAHLYLHSLSLPASKVRASYFLSIQLIHRKCRCPCHARGRAAACPSANPPLPQVSLPLPCLGGAGTMGKSLSKQTTCQK